MGWISFPFLTGVTSEGNGDKERKKCKKQRGEGGMEKGKWDFEKKKKSISNEPLFA